MQPLIVNPTEDLAERQAKMLSTVWTHISSFGPQRFARYSAEYGNKALAHYIWNVRLCETMMPLLNASEVMLKNTINNVLVKNRGAFWFDNTELIKEHEQKFVKKAREDALRSDGQGGYVIRGADDIVAELSFRFWANLLNSEYSRLWNELLIGNAFPHIPADLKDKRDKMRRTFANACDIRNRVCHHERIIHLPKLKDSVDDMKTALGWISKPYAKIIKGVCRFDEVWQGGHEDCYQSLCEMIPPPPVTQSSP